MNTAQKKLFAESFAGIFTQRSGVDCYAVARTARIRLEEEFDIKARLVAGYAAFRYAKGPADTIVFHPSVYGLNEPNTFTNIRKLGTFHVWLEYQGKYIDFSVSKFSLIARLLTQQCGTPRHCTWRTDVLWEPKNKVAKSINSIVNSFKGKGFYYKEVFGFIDHMLSHIKDDDYLNELLTRHRMLYKSAVLRAA